MIDGLACQNSKGGLFLAYDTLVVHAKAKTQMSVLEKAE